MAPDAGAPSPARPVYRELPACVPCADSAMLGTSGEPAPAATGPFSEGESERAVRPARDRAAATEPLRLLVPRGLSEDMLVGLDRHGTVTIVVQGQRPAAAAARLGAVQLQAASVSSTAAPEPARIVSSSAELGRTVSSSGGEAPARSPRSRRCVRLLSGRAQETADCSTTGGLEESPLRTGITERPAWPLERAAAASWTASPERRTRLSSSSAELTGRRAVPLTVARRQQHQQAAGAAGRLLLMMAPVSSQLSEGAADDTISPGAPSSALRGERTASPARSLSRAEGRDRDRPTAAPTGLLRIVKHELLSPRKDTVDRRRRAGAQRKRCACRS